MNDKRFISYEEYLESFRFTPEGYLRFDVLLDELIKMRTLKEDKSVIQNKLRKLIKFSDPKDLPIIKKSKIWRELNLLLIG